MNTNTHFFENVEHERTRTRVSFKSLNTANTDEHEHSCIFIPSWKYFNIRPNIKRPLKVLVKLGS